MRQVEMSSISFTKDNPIKCCREISSIADLLFADLFFPVITAASCEKHVRASFHPICLVRGSDNAWLAHCCFTFSSLSRKIERSAQLVWFRTALKLNNCLKKVSISNVIFFIKYSTAAVIGYKHEPWHGRGSSDDWSQCRRDRHYHSRNLHNEAKTGVKLSNRYKNYNRIEFMYLFRQITMCSLCIWVLRVQFSWPKMSEQRASQC